MLRGSLWKREVTRTPRILRPTLTIFMTGFRRDSDGTLYLPYAGLARLMEFDIPFWQDSIGSGQENIK